jgi:hypothetical protein
VITNHHAFSEFAWQDLGLQHIEEHSVWGTTYNGRKALMRFVVDSWQTIDAMKFWADDYVETCRVSDVEPAFNVSGACRIIIGSKEFCGVILVLKDM